MKRGEASTIFGDGSTSRDFCFVANVVQANLLAASVAAGNSVVNSVVNIACGATTSLLELHEMLRSEVARQKGVDVETLPAPIMEPFRNGDIKHSLADISRAHEALGYHPSHTVREGVEELVRAELRS
jgi:UDP-N-acetylglucosamine 4-epimerase